MGKQKKNRQGADKTFQRKKVKVGKKLPKSTNVTNTSFKTKTIHIIQQMKKEEGEATTKRKLNIKGLLPQCQHYNVTVRLGAAKGLKELLAVSEETVIAYLGLIVDRAGSLMTDKDCHVREAVLKLFESLFQKVPTKCMSPFFPVLCAHLCCAMTHINTEIQQDSLSMFDLLLTTYPVLIVSGSNQLLSNFVEQISKQKFKDMKHRIAGSKSPKLTLSIAPNRHLSAGKWQSKVLSRLFKLLSIVLKPENRTIIEYPKKSVKISDNQKAPVPFQNFIENSWCEPGFVVKTSGFVSSSAELLYNIHSIKQLVDNLFPLLLECWVESHDSEKYDGSLLYPDAIEIRSIVLDIIILLIDYGAENSDDVNMSWKKWISTKFEASFENYFISCFPFEVLQNKKNKKQKKVGVPTSPEILNLAVCNVMTKFIKSPTEFLLQQSWVQPILKYVRYLIKNPDLPLDIRRHLLQVLNNLIYAVKPNDQTAILEDCVYRYEKAHPLSQEKQMFINFFSKVIFETRDKCDLSKPLITVLESLPDLLVTIGQSNDSISTQIVTVIKNAVTTNCTPLIIKWQKCLDKVYDLESGLFISSSSDLQKLLTEVLYWLPDLNSNQSRLLAKLIQDDRMTLNARRYIIQVLHQRYLNNLKDETNMDDVADHLGFLFLIMIGSDNETNEVINRYKVYSDWTSSDHKHWQNQSELNRFICEILDTDFKSYEKLVDDVIWDSIEKKAGNSEKMDIQLVSCLMVVLKLFGKVTEVSEILTNKLIEFAICWTISVKDCCESESDSGYYLTLLEETLCRPYLKQFVDKTVKQIFSTKEEDIVMDLANMLSCILNRKSLLAEILNSSSADKELYSQSFKKVVDFVSEINPNIKNEKWLSEIEYLILQLI